MSDDDDDNGDDIFDNPTIIIDCGAREWRCGWSDEDGPGIVLPGVAATDDGAQNDKILAKFAAAFEALEVEDPSEFSMLISERPGTSLAQREVIVDALFQQHKVRALFVGAAPLLTLYNTSTETGVVVDVGETTTYILALYDGHLVTPAATAHPIAGGHMEGVAERGADASCEGLFDPSVLSSAPKNAIGLVDAILKTVALADVSLRGEILQKISLVGGGTRLSGFPERLEKELKDALKEQGSEPWAKELKVVANGDRRLAQWMGGMMICSVSSGQKQFVTRAEYEREGSSCVHGRAQALACQSLAMSETQAKDIKAKEAKALQTERQELKTVLGRQADASAAWWIAQAPVGSELERRRQRKLQQGWVHDVYERAFAEQILQLQRQQQPAAGGASSGDGGDDDGDDGDGEERHKKGPAPLPPSATLSLAASVVRLLCGVGQGGEEALYRKTRQLLVATWAADASAGTAETLAMVAKHDLRRAVRSGWRAWRAGVVSQNAARGRLTNAVKVWMSSAVGAAAMHWKAIYLREREEDAMMRSQAVQWHTTAVVAAWAGRARASKRARADLAQATIDGLVRVQLGVLAKWGAAARRTAKKAFAAKKANAQARTTGRRRGFRCWDARAADWREYAAVLKRAADKGDTALSRRGSSRWSIAAKDRKASKEDAVVAIARGRVRLGFTQWRRHALWRFLAQRLLTRTTDRLLAYRGFGAFTRWAVHTGRGRMLACLAIVSSMRQSLGKAVAVWDALAKRQLRDLRNDQVADKTVAAAKWQRRRFWRELFRLADLGRMEKWRMRLARSRSRSNEWRLWKLRLQQKKAESIEKDDIIEELRRRARDAKRALLRRRAGLDLAKWLSRAELQMFMARGVVHCDGARLAKGLRRWYAYAERRHNIQNGRSAQRKAGIKMPLFRKKWGFKKWRRWWAVENLYVGAIEALAESLPDQQRKAKADAFAYWAAEASWRIQRQKWLQRQVRMQHELADGDGRRWAQRLLNIKPDDERAWSEQNLRAVQHGREVLERALRRAKVGQYRSSDAYWLE